MTQNPSHPPYLSGLILAGRRVVVVGGGHVAQRRVAGLIAAGADVVVVSPQVTPAIEGMDEEITWVAREFAATDLDGAWYVVAATDDASVNASVAAAAEARRIFCVRADDALGGSAWTPAAGRHEGLTVGVLGNREPRRSAAVRDAVVAALRDGSLGAREARERVPGVTLVGGGPGDPDLITVAGRRALMAADVVVADRLAPRELLDELPADVELVDVAKLPRGRATEQEAINQILIDRSLAGKAVARFKGGDSFVFGRGYEEIIACRDAGVTVTVIPGLTSAVSVPGLAGIPVTHRGVAHDFTVVSGHLPPGHRESLIDWASVAAGTGTVVLMMAVANAGSIAAELVVRGRPASQPVAVVCDGGMPTQTTVVSTLASLGSDIDRHGVKPPAIIVIGDVVGLASPAAT